MTDMNGPIGIRQSGRDGISFRGAHLIVNKAAKIAHYLGKKRRGDQLDRPNSRFCV